MSVLDRVDTAKMRLDMAKESLQSVINDRVNHEPKTVDSDLAYIKVEKIFKGMVDKATTEYLETMRAAVKQSNDELYDYSEKTVDGITINITSKYSEYSDFHTYIIQDIMQELPDNSAAVRLVARINDKITGHDNTRGHDCCGGSLSSHCFCDKFHNGYIITWRQGYNL